MEVTGSDSGRSRSRALATRILGSEADADDAVQEAWLRLSRADAVDDLPARLTAVVTRLCLDQLRVRRTRATVESARADVRAPVDPEADSSHAEMAGDAPAVVLDALAPSEGLAFVLLDVFGYPFDEIGTITGRSGPAVRRMAGRARRTMQGTPESERDAGVARRAPADGRLVPRRSPRWRPRHPVVAARTGRRRACRPGRTVDGNRTCLQGWQNRWPPASTAPEERCRSRSTVGWVPRGSGPDRPRWHSSSISGRLVR